MISLDTNMLVRYIVSDDPEQTKAARVLIDNLTPDNPGFISREVIIEIVWVLERGYNFTRTRVTEVVMNLATSDSLLVENSGDVIGAAYCYVEDHASFSDIMILSAAQRSGATPLYTFDRKLARFADAKNLQYQGEICTGTSGSSRN